MTTLTTEAVGFLLEALSPVESGYKPETARSGVLTGLWHLGTYRTTPSLLAWSPDVVWSADRLFSYGRTRAPPSLGAFVASVGEGHRQRFRSGAEPLSAASDHLFRFGTVFARPAMQSLGGVRVSVSSTSSYPPPLSYLNSVRFPGQQIACGHVALNVVAGHI